jgi:UDP-N-acetylglucosamine diphosphorylase / glucose-1-phosphate thymidylyltransferase / UDP-N-acetylgalactosamine diphosphorylase / glucosamine-1-phosphate N-acetyltransferase / galactosamine-1-phosphate N-acetyltransferase
MQCVILAAGEGKRMRPLTGQRPKVMLPVANRPMLEHLVVAVRDAGIREIIFVVGYGEREIRGHFMDGSAWGVHIRYTVQRKQRGTADALNAAANHLQGRFLLMNGDMVIDTQDIAAMSKRKPPCVGLFPSSHPQDYGVVTVEGETVRSLEEKSDQPRSPVVNAGLYLFDPDILELSGAVVPSPRGELELTDALRVMIQERRLSAYALSSWLDIGSPWELLDANRTLLEKIPAKCDGTVEDGVTLQGNVLIGTGTHIKAGSYIEGPCIIGNDCRIGPHAYIRGASAIGDRCHIGHSTEIKNSIIMEDTKVPHFNYIGDSVIGRRCNFGAGTKIANLRHDHGVVMSGGRSTGREKFGAIVGDDVQFGINCSVNVGAVIGNNARISPHSLIEGVIDDNTQVR